MTELLAPALLFDSDGVLVDSDDAVEAAWSEWSRRWGLDPARVTAQVHGTPSRQTVETLIAEEDRREALTMIDRLELELATEVRALPGAIDLLSSLQRDTWAIVTSGTGGLARARLLSAGIPVPRVVVTADDVSTGKPDPEPYLAAAAGLDRQPHECLVFEDAAAGVRSARAAGVRHVVGVGRRNPGIDAFVPDLRAVTVEDGIVRLTP